MVLTKFSQNELKEIFDDTAIKVIHFYLKRALMAQPERISGQNTLPIQIPKEHLEQYIVQAIGGSGVGAGSYGVDVINDDFGADIKMLSTGYNNGKLKKDSGETSLAQNFKDTGVSLDTLFENQEWNTILEGWTEIITHKLNKVFIEHPNVKHIYYFIIIRDYSNFHLCGLKVNLDELENVIPLKKPNGQIHASSTSLYLDNFIDSNLGNVKIYRSKKRLELRLHPKYWFENNLTLEFNLDYNNPILDARTLIEENKTEEYLKNLF